MKTNIILLLTISMMLVACDKDDNEITGNFEFVMKYSATVTVGGIVGITERTFDEGEIYEGTDKNGETITIRIAEHTERNDDCPNSWCYQELLEVPRDFLTLTE